VRLLSTIPLEVCCFCEVHLVNTWIIFHSTRIWRVNCSRRSYPYSPCTWGCRAIHTAAALYPPAWSGQRMWRAERTDFPWWDHLDSFFTRNN